MVAGPLCSACSHAVGSLCAVEPACRVLCKLATRRQCGARRIMSADVHVCNVVAVLTLLVCCSCRVSCVEPCTVQGTALTHAHTQHSAALHTSNKADRQYTIGRHCSRTSALCHSLQCCNLCNLDGDGSMVRQSQTSKLSKLYHLTQSEHARNLTNLDCC